MTGRRPRRPPRAQIGGEGFATDCHGELAGRLRQIYQLERDSWSGWRDYGEVRYTSWIEADRQEGEAAGSPARWGGWAPTTTS